MFRKAFDRIAERSSDDNQAIVDSSLHTVIDRVQREWFRVKIPFYENSET